MKKKLITIWILFFIVGALIFIGLGCSGSSTGDANVNSTFNNNPQSSSSTANQGEIPLYSKGEVVVRLKKGVDSKEIASLVKGEVVKEFKIGPMDYIKIKLPQSIDEIEALKTLNNHKDKIDFAEYNYLYKAFLSPNDPAFSNRQYCHQRMQSSLAWNITTGSTSVVIAIVDTGIDGTHPEFSGRMRPGYDFDRSLPLTGMENSDEQGHGTHVTGIAAATGNNGIGIAGMNWKCKIMPVRVLNEQGVGYNVNIAQGITYAALNGANVINLSLGGKGYSQTIEDSIDYARGLGSVVVAGMGNDFVRFLEYPAASPGVIAVGSTDAWDSVSDFSTRGPWISVCAPGSEIYSTYPNNLYVTSEGTSQACPQVAGLCSLIKGVNSTWTPSQIRTQIEDTADDLGSIGFDENYGFGRINAYNALGAQRPNRYGSVVINITSAGAIQSGVDVIIKDSQGNSVFTTLTDSSGNAIFYDVPKGSYQASATFNNVVKNQNITVAAGAMTNQNIDF